VAGVGGIIFYPGGNKVADFSWGLGISTINQAEWLALYHSLEIAVTINMDHLPVFGDSRHVIQAMRNGSSSKSSMSQRFQRRIKNFELPIDTLFFHVLRDLNPIADRLANVGATMKIGHVTHNNVLEQLFIP
jgi:ribonuclease HI